MIPARKLSAALVAVLLTCWTLAQPAPAAAHPLGNFTINRYSRLELSPERLRIRYVVDMAEIPTFQALPSLDTDGNGAVTEAEKSAYAARQLAEIARNLSLTLNDRGVALQSTEHQVDLLPGQAGLQTLRLTAWLDAPAAGALLAQSLREDRPLKLDYRDDNDPSRLGWREMLVRAEGVALQGIGGTAVPTRDVSDELRAYPEDLLNGPLDVRALAFTAAPGAAGVAGDAAATRGGARRGDSLARSRDGLTELVATATLTPAIVALALLTAIVLGGMHAMSPGHGKTIVGAYLVGTRGTAKHALFLGLTVTLVHTAGVFALGLGTLFASQYVVPDQVYPWMSFASGLLVLAMGVSLMRARWPGIRNTAQAAADGHTHGGHVASSLTHSHGTGSHSHAVPGADGAPVTWRSLLALGISGGLLPCPSALVVMLGAIALHRVAFGLLLIVFFSIGLAGTLMAIGLLMVYSGRAAGRLRLGDRLAGGRAARLLAIARLLPVASAAVVALVGAALAYEAAGEVNLPYLWSTSAVFRTVVANVLSLGVGAAAVYLALRRSPAPAPAFAQAGHGHSHVHDHAHDHAHEDGQAHEPGGDAGVDDDHDHDDHADHDHDHAVGRTAHHTHPRRSQWTRHRQPR